MSRGGRKGREQSDSESFEVHLEMDRRLSLRNLPGTRLLGLALILLLTIVGPTNADATTSVHTITETATGAASASATSSSQFTSDSEFEQAMLQAHNFYRKEHNASNLVWNDTSAEYAQNWAGDCEFKHSGGPTGENLAAGYANGSASVDAWGLEREHYNFNKPGFSEATGHFTQVVWGNTTSVGCGRTNCSSRNTTPGWYVVCEYYPPGNIVGDDNNYFRWNVHAQVEGHASDTVESGVTSAASSAREWLSLGSVLVSAGVLILAWC